MASPPQATRNCSSGCRQCSAGAGVSSRSRRSPHRREQLIEITRLVDAGELRPEIDSVYPLEEARAAFERSLQRGKRGKVVLRVT